MDQNPEVPVSSRWPPLHVVRVVGLSPGLQIRLTHLRVETDTGGDVVLTAEHVGYMVMQLFADIYLRGLVGASAAAQATEAAAIPLLAMPRGPVPAGARGQLRVQRRSRKPREDRN